MEVEDNNDGENDNDTIDTTRKTLDSAYEELVVMELDSFSVGAITNLEVGLVDNNSYKNGTWFANRSQPADQPQNITQTQSCQP